MIICLFQQYKESEEAQRYVTFYPITEWPYVAILDPRTGELMVTWKKIDGTTFCDLVTEFLSLHPNLEPSSQSESNENSQSGSETGPEPKKVQIQPKKPVRGITYVSTERIFDSRPFMCKKTFLKKLLQKLVVHIFTLLLAHFASKSVNYSRHSESLNNRKNAEINDIFIR